MVEYLADIAEQTRTNNVVQKAYGGVLGLNVSDFAGITNLLPTVSSITNTSMTASDMVREVNSKFTSMLARTSLTTMMENITKNVEFSLGANIAGNPFLLGTYKALGAIENIGEGLPLPTISVMGNSVDLSDLAPLIKTGLAGFSVLSTFI